MPEAHWSGAGSSNEWKGPPGSCGKLWTPHPTPQGRQPAQPYWLQNRPSLCKVFSPHFPALENEQTYLSVYVMCASRNWRVFTSPPTPCLCSCSWPAMWLSPLRVGLTPHLLQGSTAFSAGGRGEWSSQGAGLLRGALTCHIAVCLRQTSLLSILHILLWNLNKMDHYMVKLFFLNSTIK